MTIDPTNFEPQGKPTDEQLLRVWEECGRPASRKLAAILEQRGWKISYRTLCRKLELGEPGTKALAHRGKVKGVKHEISKALQQIPEPVRQAADEMKDKGIAPAVNAEIAEGKTAGAIAQDKVQAEVDIIDARIKELLLKSEADLDGIEQKSRKILNIVLTEAAARRANVMVLIPKDTGAFVQAMTEASKQTLTGGLEQPPKAGDPRTIEGDAIDITPQTPLQSSLSKFFQDEELV